MSQTKLLQFHYVATSLVRCESVNIFWIFFNLLVPKFKPKCSLQKPWVCAITTTPDALWNSHFPHLQGKLKETLPVYQITLGALFWASLQYFLLSYGWTCEQARWSKSCFQILFTSRLPKQARWTYLSWVGPSRKSSPFGINNKLMLHWPSLFIQDGWILAFFFFSIFTDLDFVLRSINKQKKELGQY